MIIHFNPLNAELNPICHLLALLVGETIVVVSRLRVNRDFSNIRDWLYRIGPWPRTWRGDLLQSPATAQIILSQEKLSFSLYVLTF
jgi:hypothetical protein